MVYHKIVNIVFCALQWDLVVYPFCTLKFTSVNPNHPLHSFPSPVPLGIYQSVLYRHLFLIPRVAFPVSWL